MKQSVLVLILSLLIQPASVLAKVHVHTPSWPKDVTPPKQASDYLFLEGENQSEKVADDELAKPEQKHRTLFRIAQYPNDKWWSATTSHDKSRFAQRGANKNMPWHRLIWDVSNATLKPALYDVYARVYIFPGGSCELAFTTGDDKPQQLTSNKKTDISWVHVGSIQMTDQIQKAQLHIRTKKASVYVDTVLLVKVQPKEVSVNLQRKSLTPLAWSKGKGLVYTTESAHLEYQSNAPQRIKDFELATRLKPDAPLNWTKLSQTSGAWPIKLPHPGWFDVHVKATLDNGQQLTREFTAVVLGEPIDEQQRSKSVFGLWNVHGDKQLIKLAGGRWNRAMTSFRDVTQEQANAVISSTSESAHPYSQKNGLDYIGVLSFGMPMWAMQVPEGFKKHGFGNPFYPAKNWDDISRSVAAFARSRPLPLIMEMYNEPLAHWKGTHAQLVTYARAVRKGLKSVDPNFNLGGPCLYSIRIGDLENLAKVGLFDELDSIVMHAYVDGTPPEDAYFERIIALKNLLKEYGQQDKPVYLTEFGWTAADGTWQPPVDRWTQTRYVARSLALGWSQGIDAMIYFTLQYKTKNTGEAAFSLIDQSNRPQPGYVAFAGVSKWFAGSTPIGHYQLTPTAHMVMGHREGKLQLSVWDTAGNSEVQLPFIVTRATDMFGKPLQVNASSIAISPDPIYLEAQQDGLIRLPMLPVQTVTAMEEVKEEVVWPIPHMEQMQASLKAGQYIGFSKVNGHWQVVPVDLVSPLHLSELKMQWPANRKTPQLLLTLQSHLSDQSQTATVWRKDQPHKKVTLEIPANAMRQVIFNITDFKQAQASTHSIMMQTPEGKVMEQSVNWTALVATDGKPIGNWADFTAWAPFGKQSVNPMADTQGQVRLSYNNAGINVQVRVTDDEHHQPYVHHDPQKLWAADSVQLAFDMDILKPWQAGVVGSGLAGHRVFEFSIAGTATGHTEGTAGGAFGGASGGGQVFCNRSYDQSLPANTLRPEIHASVSRDAKVTLYDIHFPWDQLGVSSPMARGDVIGFALAVNDVDPDANKKRHGLRLFKGIAMTKDAKQFGKVWLH